MNNLLNKKNKTKIQRKIPIVKVQNCHISQLNAKNQEQLCKHLYKIENQN